jgi:immunity protein Imm1 of predicted polymorphic toxin system
MIALYLDGRVTLDARVEDIDAAIASLGAEHTLMVVELPSGTTITVGGGPDRFVTEVAKSATDRLCVVDPRQPGGDVELLIEGERFVSPARLCVDRDAVREAVRTFVADDGARSPRLEWSVPTRPS